MNAPPGKPVWVSPHRRRVHGVWREIAGYWRAKPSFGATSRRGPSAAPVPKPPKRAPLQPEPVRHQFGAEPFWPRRWEPGGGRRMYRVRCDVCGVEGTNEHPYLSFPTECPGRPLTAKERERLTSKFERWDFKGGRWSRNREFERAATRRAILADGLGVTLGERKPRPALELTAPEPAPQRRRRKAAEPKP